MRIATRAKLTEMLRSTLLAVGAGAALGLGGCAQIEHATDMIQPPPVNPSSPIAPYAEAVSRQTFPTPSFQSVPPKPTDVRLPGAYKDAVVGELEFRRQLAAWRAVNPQLTSDTEAWADLQRKHIPKSFGAPVSPTQDAESAAFAKRLREEALKSQPQQ